MKAKAAGLLLGAVAVLVAGEVRAEVQPVQAGGTHPGESPRNAMLEFKMGLYLPLIDSEPSLTSHPYANTFNNASMLLAQLEVDRELWQGFGTAAIGFSVGYAEKYAAASQLDPNTGQPTASAEATGLFVVPLRLLGIYRFDWPALHWGIPLVPYGKVALAYTPWWTTKGSVVETVNGARGAGGKWGYGFTGGVSFVLDVLEPSLAKDLDTDLGINHTYLFAEYVYENVNNFGRTGLVLSGRYWSFGLAFEF